jgi:hypothetical protein
MTNSHAIDLEKTRQAHLIHAQTHVHGPSQPTSLLQTNL